MAKRALVVGINTYDNATHLTGSVADAQAVGRLLQTNVDGSPNYNCRVLPDHLENGAPITRSALRAASQLLFSYAKDDVILYFSGHGILTPFGGYLCTTDAQPNDWGIPMPEIMQMANDSLAANVLIILDCCNSGDLGNPSLLTRSGDPLATIKENVTVIAASLPSQLSFEDGGHGLFTAALLDALNGGAADHMGYVSAPAIYAYVERRFGASEQRPVYKSYATGVTVVRQCAPLIDRLKLRQLVDLFPSALHQYPLDAEYEPEDEFGVYHQPVNRSKVQIAQLLKDYRDAGLLKATEPNEQLFWVARRGHTVELTQRGREYWWLVQKKKI